MPVQEWNPGTLLELSGSYWQTCALHASVKLDIFTRLADRKLSTLELANEMAISDGRGLTMLLNALVAMNLLVKSNDSYATTEASRSFLSKESDQYIGFMVMHHHYLMDAWGHLDQAVLSGKPVRSEAGTL